MFSIAKRTQLQPSSEEQKKPEQTLSSNFVDFLSNFSLPCYHFLVETRVTTYERYFYHHFHFILNQTIARKKSFVQTNTIGVFILFHFRVLWFIVHLFSAVAVIFFIIWSLDNEQANPFVTTLYDTAYPITKIGFPSMLSNAHSDQTVPVSIYLNTNQFFTDTNLFFFFIHTAVYVCSNNIISKRRAQAYAEYL